MRRTDGKMSRPQFPEICDFFLRNGEGCQERGAGQRAALLSSVTRDAREPLDY
jgi:hypothetical protein